MHADIFFYYGGLLFTDLNELDISVPLEVVFSGIKVWKQVENAAKRILITYSPSQVHTMHILNLDSTN